MKNIKTSNKIILGVLAALFLNILCGFVLLRNSLGPGGIGFGDTIIEGSGNLETVRLEVADFSRLEVENNFDITLVQGKNFIEITAEENLVNHFRPEVGKYGMLRLNAKKGHTLVPKKSIQMTIGFEYLEEINSYGGGIISAASTLNFEKIEIRGQGASKINIPLVAKRLYLKLGAVAKANLNGTVESAEISTTGMSQLNGGNLSIQKAEIKAKGMSETQINVSESLKIEAKERSTIQYTGNPKVNQYASESSKIIKK